MRYKESRADRVRLAPGRLAMAGYDCEVFDYGQHLKLSTDDLKVDFWPFNGHWISATNSGQGVESLIEHLNTRKKK